MLWKMLILLFTSLASAICKALCYIVQSSDMIYKSASRDQIWVSNVPFPIHLSSKIIYEKIMSSTYLTTFGIL